MFRQLTRWLRGAPATSEPLPSVTPAPAPQQDWLAQGNAALGEGRIEQALECYHRATLADPSNPLAWLNHGFALLELGQATNARESLWRSLALAKPGADFVRDAYFLSGQAWLAEGDPTQAQAAFQRALAAAPGFTEARVALADSLLAQDRAQEALALVDGSPPQAHSLALAMAGARALHELGRSDEALATLDSVLAQQPGHAPALDGRGNVLMRLDRHEEALVVFEQATQAGGANADRLSNLSSAAHQLGRLQEALSYADRALALDPGNARARWNRGLIHLQRGELQAGWADYEARWAAQTVPAWMRSAGNAPQWQGQDLRGRSILLTAEQGLGDCIQFLRYTPLIAARGARVWVLVPDSLAALVRDSALPVSVLASTEPVPVLDFQCPLMSLPGLLGTRLDTIPAAVPYLRADAQLRDRWEGSLAGQAQGRLRIGLVWSGNSAHQNDRNRSIPLELFRQQLSALEVFFVQLQPEVRPSDVAALEAWPALHPVGPQLRDFGDTAAAIEALDIVLCVDTSVAHMAGAAGRPVWILLPWMPDWRWMLEREDNPWYPTARLFRQTTPRDWSEPLRRVRAELEALVERRYGR